MTSIVHQFGNEQNNWNNGIFIRSYTQQKLPFHISGTHKEEFVFSIGEPAPKHDNTGIIPPSRGVSARPSSGIRGC
jgi:hypothetical protein